MDWMKVHYRIDGSAVASRAQAEALAQALALEQSVEVPLAAVFDPWVRESIVGRVDAVEAREDGGYDVHLRLAEATCGFDPAQTINMLFGNASMHEHVRFVDAEFTPAQLARLPKPRFGIEGLRRVTGVHGRPLTCAALKPQGLPPEALARQMHVFAAEGVDIIKDDHGLADQSYSRFTERVRACQRALVEANRANGRRAVYAPSLVGSPRVLVERVRFLKDEGVGAALLAPALLGLPVFAELVAEHIDVPVLAHPSHVGAARVAPALMLGKLFRLWGADAVIFPGFGGRFAYSPAQCAAISAAARAPLGAARPALPVPAGGMTVERVPELVDFYGVDSMLLIGGSLLVAGDELPARTRAFVDGVARAVR